MRKKYKDSQILFLVPFPGLPGISEGSEIASRMLETAPHPCSAGLHS